jgi:hypothetical protein
MPVGWAVAMVALWLTVVALSAVVLTLTRRVASLSTMPAAPLAFGPPEGTVLPHAAGEEGGGPGKTRLYLFLSASCGPCRILVDKLREADWSLVTRRGVEVVVVADAVFDGSTVGVARLLLSTRSATSERFGVRATPYALVVDEKGVVRAGKVPGSFDDLVAIAGVVEQGRAATAAGDGL